MLPIKGSAYIHSGHLVLGLGTEHFAWHLVSGTSCVHFVVGRKRVLSQNLAAASNSKNAFLLFAKPVRVVGARAPPLPSQLRKLSLFNLN